MKNNANSKKLNSSCYLGLRKLTQNATNNEGTYVTY